ncbi:MAG: dihydroorotate dehydrogenase-like protein [Rhodothermia bacterium]
MDLSTTYMGLELSSPLVPSASPLARKVQNIQWMEDEGAAAVVLHSLFEEQIVDESEMLDHFLSYGEESTAEALSYYPDPGSYSTGPDEYLELVRAASKTVDIPIIGSLNGVSTGGWTDYAKLIQEAGAKALELNIYYIPTDPEMDSGMVEQMYVDVVSAVCRSVSIPVAVKIGPFFSSPVNMARKMVGAGVSALVLFNRFYQPDFDLDNLEVVPHLVLSTSDELRLPLRWIAIMYGKVCTDFALTGGIHTPTDALKAIMAGANVAMMTSALLNNGIEHISETLSGMWSWMEEHEYESIGQMRGSMSQRNVAQPAAFERANYMKVLQSWSPDPTGQLL